MSWDLQIISQIEHSLTFIHPPGPGGEVHVQVGQKKNRDASLYPETLSEKEQTFFRSTEIGDSGE